MDVLSSVLGMIARLSQREGTTGVAKKEFASLRGSAAAPSYYVVRRSAFSHPQGRFDGETLGYPPSSSQTEGRGKYCVVETFRRVHGPSPISR